MAPVQWGTVEIVEIPLYTEEEAQAVWYEPEELERIAAITWDTVNKLNHGEVPQNKNHRHEDDDHCTRGLEDMTVRGSLERLVAKYRIDLVVLEEQRLQKAKGARDEEALARKSREESQRHVHKAVEYGKRDQESANKYLNRVQEPSTSKPAVAAKQPWFRRRSWQGQERKKRPLVRVGMSMRSILGMKR